jgi:hypothetical protein
VRSEQPGMRDNSWVSEREHVVVQSVKQPAFDEALNLGPAEAKRH